MSATTSVVSFSHMWAKADLKKTRKLFKRLRHTELTQRTGCDNLWLLASLHFSFISAEKLHLNAPHRLQLTGNKLICSAPASPWKYKPLLWSGSIFLHRSWAAVCWKVVEEKRKEKLRQTGKASDSKLSPLSVMKIKRLFIQFVKAVEVFLHDFEMKEPELQKCF